MLYEHKANFKACSRAIHRKLIQKDSKERGKKSFTEIKIVKVRGTVKTSRFKY